MAKRKDFPFEFELKKEVLFYPDQPKDLNGYVLEIGPGRGDVILNLAAQKPNEQFIAVEIGKKRYHKLIRRLEKRDISNVRLILGDAHVVLPQYFQADSFQKIFVLFPDPWPKDRHAYKRLLTIQFLWLLAHFLQDQGQLIIGTDDLHYARWVESNLAEVSVLKNSLTTPFTSQCSELPETFFEAKWRDLGREIYFFKYVKTSVD